MRKFPKLDKRYKFIDSRSSANPSRINVKNMPRNIIVKLLKTNDNEKILKIFRE